MKRLSEVNNLVNARIATWNSEIPAYRKLAEKVRAKLFRLDGFTDESWDSKTRLNALIEFIDLHLERVNPAITEFMLLTSREIILARYEELTEVVL